MFFSIVTAGPGWPGQTVFDTEAEARDAIQQGERDLAAGEFEGDQLTVASARVNAYSTRQAAERANISDTGPDNSGRSGTPGFVRTVYIR